MIAMVALMLLTALTAFSDLLKLANSPRSETLKNLHHLCVLIPLIFAFACQPKLVAKVLADKRAQRVVLSDHLPSFAPQASHLTAPGSLESESRILVTH